MPNLSSKRRRMKKATTKPLVRVEERSGNVFADLGIAQPELALVKAKLLQQIRALIAEKGLTQAQAAKLLALDQPKVSALVRGRTNGYTIDRLFKFLNLLGQQIDITIRPAMQNSSASESLVMVTTH
jgi:predicted XRE-type DNA-binding protein